MVEFQAESSMGFAKAQRQTPSSPASQFGPNEWLVEEMYEQFLADPTSVDPAWHDFFDDYKPTPQRTHGVARNAALTPEALPLRGVPFGEPLTGHTRSVSWGAWGQVDGHPVLATDGGDGVVRLWDPATGRAHGEPLTGHTDLVLWGAWGQVDGRPMLATGGGDGAVRLWDPATGRAHGEPLIGHTDWIRWGTWGQVDGRPVLATGGDDGVVRLWDPAAGRTLGKRLAGHAGAVRWGAWGEIEGRPVLATGGRDSTVLLWDAATGRTLGQPLTGHAGSAHWGKWGEIGDRPVLATGSAGAVLLWDATTGRALGEPLTGHTDWVLWGAWGQVDGRPVLATGGRDSVVRLWEVVADRAVARLPPYRSDTAGDTDALSRAEDAVALAELIVARTARPPLAVGLFGDWGEGKSHFLQLLRRQVQITAHPSNKLAHHAVRQVWFNAWHYAEADLWASLVAELFAQLAHADTDNERGAQQRAQSRLMAEVIAERGLAERLQAARERRDDLQQALRRAEPDAPVPWSMLTPNQRAQLEAHAGDSAEKIYRTAVRSRATVAETSRGLRKMLREMPRAHVLAVTGVLLVLLAGTAIIAWGVPMVARWLASIPAVVAIATTAGIVWRLRDEAATRLGPAWRAAVKLVAATVKATEEHRARLRTAAEVAAAEVAALERELQNLTAAGQLAGFVTDRASGGDYRSRLGIMTQIREDFQHMAKLLADAAATAISDTPDIDIVGDPLPRVDRIVLYIDDLDRCPPHRVVAMLEAIHLLLAVDLFVVVVAVDPRWLLRAIATHYRDLLTGTAAPNARDSGEELIDPDLDNDELTRSTPEQYLEKIFQVVLTLPPLESQGYQHLLRTLVGTRPDQPAPPPAASSTAQDHTGPTDPSAANTVGDHGQIPEAVTPSGPLFVDPMFGVRMPAPRQVDRVDPLTLDPDELTLLDLLGPPHLISTPRAVKRLANSYGLLTALRRDHRATDLADQQATVLDAATGTSHEVTYRPYRAGLVLLGALVAFPALGSALLIHLHRIAQQQPHHRWDRFITDLAPTSTSGHWSSPAEPVMTTVQARQWETMLHGLHEITRQAAGHGLPLPEPLSAWAAWVVPVGRLSFPAGRVVNTLRPTPRPAQTTDTGNQHGPSV